MSRLRLGLTAAALLALVQAQPNCPGQAPVRKGETINVHVAPHTRA